MKIIIAGNRYFEDYDFLKRGINNIFRHIENEGGKPLNNIMIVSGGARGTDTMAARFAKENNIPFKEFRADWGKHGRAAGPIRNQEMADFVKNGDCLLIAFWDYESRGTRSMIEIAHKERIQTYIFKIKNPRL